MKAGKSLVVIIISMLMMLGYSTPCSAKKQESVIEFKVITVGDFGPREKKVSLSKDTEKELEKKGYIKIGSISGNQDVKRCYDDDCKKVKGEDPTKTILKKAHTYGGDLVTISRNNVSTRHEGWGEKCVKWEKGDPGHTLDYLIDPMGAARRDSGRPRGKLCAEYTESFLKIDGLNSEGFVWRHEPDFLKVSSALVSGAGLTWARVSEYDKFGFIDGNGRFVIEQEYTEAGDFSEGLAPVTYTKYDQARKSYEKFSGYIDSSGKLVIQLDVGAEPGKPEKFSEGLAAVRNRGLWGFIDRTGKYVIKPQYKYAARSFSDGLAGVKVGNLWGFINKTGKMVIQPKYDGFYNFSEGLAAAKVGELFGFIDRTGKAVIRPQYLQAGKFSDGLAMVAYEKIGDYKYKRGYVDRSGKMVIRNLIDAGEFSNGLALVRKENSNKSGFIDRTGNFISEPKWVIWRGLKEGLSAFKMTEATNTWGYINKKGQIVIKPRFRSASDFSGGLATVSVSCTGPERDLFWVH